MVFSEGAGLALKQWYIKELLNRSTSRKAAVLLNSVIDKNHLIQ